MLRGLEIQLGRRIRRRNAQAHATGTSLVRTMVVACATLAILLVCFSIYQYSQREQENTTFATKKRLPNVETSLQEALGEQDAEATSGIKVGPANVGAGEKARLTLYRPGQDTAWGEIEVEDYSRIAESNNEFLMIAPEFRMRTPDDHAIRVTAEKCIVEGELGAGLKISRGQLIGNVLIEYDRLTKQEREKLASLGVEGIDPMQLVRIEAPSLWFDVEYSKLTIPDELHVVASDILFDAQDVEVRFDELRGQVDYFRVTGGGSLELLSPPGEMGDGGALGSGPGETRLSLGVWLMDTFAKLVLAQQPAKEGTVAEVTPEVEKQALENDTASSDVDETTKPEIEYDAEGVPIFKANKDGRSKNKKAAPPVRYVAHFEGEVDAQQRVGDVIESRLRSEVLEIVRSFGDQDRQRLGGDADTGVTETKAAENSTSAKSNKRTRLTWTRRLSVQACTDADPRCGDDRETVIVAKGHPVRMDGSEGSGVCDEVQFDPATSSVVMVGSASSPVILKSASEGLIQGRKISTTRRDDMLDFVIEGPGSLKRSISVTKDANDGSVQDNPSRQTSIAFRDRLETSARYSTITKLDRSFALVTKQRRHIEQAVFTGEVKLRDDDLHLDSDRMIVDFAPIERQHDDNLTIEQVRCRGRVRMIRHQDSIRSEELDVQFTQSRNGQMLPLRATARTDIEVAQGSQVIQADDELVVDFEHVERPAPPFNAAKAYNAAKKAGIDPKTVDWSERRRTHESKTRIEVGVKSMSARGDVVIDDPAQQLEVSAASFECAVDGDTIESAVVMGKPGTPATVALEDMTISGPQITLNVRDDWAMVPGAGRLSMMSRKSLDGKRLEKPTPIVITWTKQMRYQGRENRAVFKGAVHAASATDTTFDGEEMLVEFDDVSVPTTAKPAYTMENWWLMDAIAPLVASTKDVLSRTMNPKSMLPLISRTQTRLPSIMSLHKAVSWYANTGLYWPLAANLGKLLPSLSPRERNNDLTSTHATKEPVYILATGGAKVQVVDRDEATGDMQSRSVLAGPQLSVNLRPDVSKMLIEGAGYLQLENHQVAKNPTDAKKPTDAGLLDTGSGSGPSITLIEWGEFMSYDFSIDQTRFEGRVNLKHFAGSEIVKRFGAAFPKASQDQAGRATFLNCDTLTADFRANPDKRRQKSDQKLGLNARNLRQFKAAGNVTLQDQVEGIAISATDLTFERERKVLVIQGTEYDQAHIVLQRPGRFPLELSTKRAFYNLADKSLESEGASIRGQ